ncbi:hypothetical protein BVC80_9093g115 [Macleaya cordata]|uniref:Uncharacterized protein n=1 Tax=Macleaya cordata TaxID=56857 RepID=A0A200PX54_MACCD|nr:hypothetical protein BVC80_9093g115 [Macleaya cordata]
MHRRALNLFCGLKILKVAHNGPRHLYVLFYHQLQAPHKVILTPELAFQKLNKMTQVLKNVDLIDGKLVNIEDDSVVMDDRIEHRLKTFKSLARLYLGSPSVQQSLTKKAIGSSAAMESIPKSCFGQPSEREPMTLNTLTKVCNYLNVPAQQRKSVRFTICPQVTQHRIWAGTLEEILMGLKSEIESLNHRSSSRRELKLSEQIISSCLRFLSDTAISTNPDSTSWMRLTPTKRFDSPPSRRWEDLLEMFNDLFKCLRNENGTLYHMSKLEAMKEGMFQIKDVLVDRDIGYKEARHQESLVQKKLSKTLGHPSQCLFTLLQYYLHGSVRDPEIEVCGGVYERGDNKGGLCLCIGKILTSDEEKMVWVGVKQLDKALGLFKFVWETAERKEVLELQGHLWCVGVDDRILNYRGNVFFLHGIRL